MKKRNNRGLMAYVVVIAVFLLMAITINQFSDINEKTAMTEPIHVEYSNLLEMIQEDQVERVAIQNNKLVGLKRGTTIAASEFPEKYDFDAIIGSDFLMSARQIEASRSGKELDAVSVNDLRFKVDYTVPDPTPWWYAFLPEAIMMVVLIGVYFLMIRKMMGGKQNPMTFGKINANVQAPGENKITFADVAGCEEEKEELAEMVDFLKNPKNYTDVGARIPKGVLLVGPPGTGKTLLAKAVAGEAGVPFFSISGSDFVEMFVGVGASRVRDLFSNAKRNAPAIVFIDEIDAVGRRRGAGLGGGHDEREQTLNQLLVEMDGFAANQGVIVMAATNRRDILDPALLRPGRFDRQVTVNLPDQAGRVAILKVHSKGKPLAADVDLDNIAKRAPFSSGADLANIMNEAAILTARAHKKIIDQKTMIEAISRVQMGHEKKSHHVEEEDRRMVAIHEGGHAIVGHFLKGCDDVHLITIVPRGQAAGHTLSLPSREHDNMSRTQILDTICMMLGGHAAEDVGIGEIYTGSSSDLKRATELCRRMVTEFGMSDRIGTIYLGSDQEVFVGNSFGQSREYSEQVAAEIDEEVRRLLAECYERAKSILREHHDRLESLTEALLQYSTVYRREFVALMDEGIMPTGAGDEDEESRANFFAPGTPKFAEEPCIFPEKTIEEAAEEAAEENRDDTDEG